MDRIHVIERSMHCFWAGCLAMIPLLGIIPAIMAICFFYGVRNEAGKSWNPARAYSIWGLTLACLGLSMTIVGVLVRFSKYLF